MKLINHYIITRFSLNIKGLNSIWPNDKNQVFDENRLKERFDIFVKITLPSVICQTNHNFTWIILIDPLLPINWSKRLREICKPYPNFKIIVHDWKQAISHNYWLKYFETEKSEYVITTRLDDDDSIASFIVNSIQSQIEDKYIYKFITFRNGILSENDIKFNFPYPSNKGGIAIGMSLIAKELFSDNLNIYAVTHTDIIGYIHKYLANYSCKLKIIETKEPAWLYYRHPNASSKFNSKGLQKI